MFPANQGSPVLFSPGALLVKELKFFGGMKTCRSFDGTGLDTEQDNCLGDTLLQIGQENVTRCELASFIFNNIVT